MVVKFVCFKQKTPIKLNFLRRSKENTKQCTIIFSNSPIALEPKKYEDFNPEKCHKLLVYHDELRKTETNFLLYLVKRRESSAVLAQFPVFKKEKGKLAQLQIFQNRKVFRKLKLLLPTSLLLRLKQKLPSWLQHMLLLALFSGRGAIHI